MDTGVITRLIVWDRPVLCCQFKELFQGGVCFEGFHEDEDAYLSLDFSTGLRITFFPLFS